MLTLHVDDCYCVCVCVLDVYHDLVCLVLHVLESCCLDYCSEVHVCAAFFLIIKFHRTYFNTELPFWSRILLLLESFFFSEWLL